MLGMRREPAHRRSVHSASFFLVDHLERMSERLAAFLLHLDDEDSTTAPHYEIKLVPPDARVGREEPVAAKSVVAEGAPLSAVHAAS